MTVRGLSLLFLKPGDPGGIQTHDLQNRNLTLYSAKLRSLNTILSDCDCEDNNKSQRNNCSFTKKSEMGPKIAQISVVLAPIYWHF